MNKNLNNNINIPPIGFGTDLIPEGETIINSVKWAIQTGYRLIDNADCYKNEYGVGLAVKECIEKGITSRKELFITNKVPDWKQGYDSTIKCCKESLERTGLEYFDLYLIHSPYRQHPEWKRLVLDSYRALEKLYEDGLVKAIGVSNFEIRHLEYILSEARIKPFINQIELHSQHQQKNVVDFCKNNNILLEGWGTVNQGRIFKNKIFLELAQKYGRNPSQIAIRWSLQKGYIPLVRSTKKEHIEVNFDVFNFKLKEEDMKLLDSLDGGEFSNWHHDGLTKWILMTNPEQYNPGKYTRTYKLFNLIVLLKEKRYNWNKTKWLLFGFIPIIKISKKELL